MIRFWIELSLEIGICSMAELAMKETSTYKGVMSYLVSMFCFVGAGYFITSMNALVHRQFYKIGN